MSGQTDPDVPPAVTYREMREIVRTFYRSGWTGMTLHMPGLRIAIGKDRPPAGPAPATTSPAVTLASPAAPPAVPPAPPAVAPPGAAAVPAEPAGSAADRPGAGAVAVDTAGCVAVPSPAVGTFWVAPGPGEPPFVRVGQAVGPDEQLAIVEVMKLMNPVVAPVAGEVVAVCAQNAEMVEYEQVLFWIRPDDG